MDPALGLGFRHTLHPVYTAFVLEPGIGTLTGDGKADLLEASKLRRIGTEHLLLPASGFRIHGIHPIQGIGKQRSLLSPGAAPDLDDDIPVVVGIFGQQQDLQLFCILRQLFLFRFKFRLRHLPQLRILRPGVQQLSCLLHGLGTALVCPVFLYDGFQVLIFLHQLCVHSNIRGHCRIREPLADFLKLLLHDL